jgi:protein phosphatase
MNKTRTKIIFFGISDKGLRRENNEDHFIVADLTRHLVGVLDNKVTPSLICHEVGEHGTLVAVADGLGGHEDGEIASQIAVETVVEALFHPKEPHLSTQEWLTEAVDKAHSAIRAHLTHNPPGAPMGSTLTAVHVGHGTLTIAQVGDSRAYKFCDGKLTLLTEDQTLVNMLQKRGMLTDEEAENHPGKHIILQALGQDKNVVPELQSHFVADGDCVLLCTDGLSSYVDHAIIEAILASEGDEHSHCQRLIDAANASGGADNVTVLLARLRVTKA